ncbi:MAG: T9SS type A sorting domain-containing protein [Bacteroidetes bacterium]|nr:T9SS type A sorting domain-containing protein [Bacteroidota bacterium]MBU1717994.1 T9SS type A sorting domain-containing protein [Bacteroidota bacterium]
MKRTIYFFLILAFDFFFSPGFAQTVPANWTSLYNGLEAKVRSIDSIMTAEWDGIKHCTNYCTNLMPANSSQGPDLLTQMPSLYVVKKHLDALDSIGINTIDLAIQYPTLVSAFPQSSEYLEYYKLVVQEIRNRGMKIIVGCQATVRDSVYGHMPVDSFYIGLDATRYKTEKLQMIQTIIDTLQPDYLTIEMEPQTQADNLPIDFSLNSVMDYVDFFMQGMVKNGVQIGAGSGTWDDLMFIDSIARLPDIDFIDYHIYPINQSCFIDKVFQIDSIATLYNKKLVIGESWLFKATDAELLDTTLSPADLFYRDVFSFWIPLDSLFFTSVVKLSHYSKTEVTSLIWSNLFFAYIDHIPAYDAMWPGQIVSIAYTEAGPNILSNTLTPTGELYRTLIADACDTASSTNSNLKKHDNPIRIYPNPNSGIFTLEISCPGRQNVKYWISTPAGKTVMRHSINWTDQDERAVEIVNLSALPKGIYFVNVITESYSACKKVMVF